MRPVRSAARFVADHWLLVLAIAVNLAIAVPAGAVKYRDNTCETADGEGIELCCTTCWFFCSCSLDEGF